MRHEPIVRTHRVTVHPDWCGCRACQPPAPSDRPLRTPAPAVLIGSALGIALGAGLHLAAGDQLAAAFLAATGG